MKSVLQILLIAVNIGIWLVISFNAGRDYARQEFSAYVDQFIATAEQALKECRQAPAAFRRTDGLAE